MKYLGIDYGSKRVGVAVSDDNGKMAFPIEVLENKPDLLEKIGKISAEKGVGEIVIGESNNFSGEPNLIMAEIKKFAERLKSELKMVVHFEPEFMSSVQAVRIQGENPMLDASAAAIILQSFLDKFNNREKTEKKISHEDFTKVEIRVGKILTAEKILGADKLLKLSVDFGENKTRQVISGIAETFTDPSVLPGTNCLFVTNLEPRVIRGFESQAMILATGDKADIVLFKPDKPVSPGAKVR